MTTAKQKIITVDGLMAAAFDQPREPRSSAYCCGVRTILAHRIDGASLALPFEIGTAEADAFFAGEDEGRLILARVREAEQVA